MNRFVKVAVSCAECGKVRGEANHWFQLVPSGTDTRLYAVYRLVSVDSIGDNDQPACGESCLTKLEGKILSGKKL